MREQRFNRSRWDAYDAVLEEFAEERGNALGRAGIRLTEAVAEYRELVEGGGGPEQVAAALAQARDAAWALSVQRECAGFRSPNLNWLREHWQVPDEVLRLI